MQDIEHPTISSAWLDGHYYSPIPDAAEAHKRWNNLYATQPKTIPGVHLQEEEQLALLETLRPYCSSHPFQEHAQPNLRYSFQKAQDAFGYTDAMVLHAMIRWRQPRRIVEIGSGWSSCVILDTCDHNTNIPIHYTCIDPFPQTIHSHLVNQDRQYCDFRKEPLQDIEPAIFSSLEKNDILFIDSSHMYKAGSDVQHLFNNILPHLQRGVRIHFHDIFYPFEYPLSWIEEGRAWNEAYVLRAFLQYNTCFSIELWNDFLALFHSKELYRCVPGSPGNTGGSLWLCKTL